MSTSIISGVRGVTRHVIRGNAPIKKGAPGVARIMRFAANRDEPAFDKPFDLVIARDPNPHAAFPVKGGAHHCLGAMLARAAIRAASDQAPFEHCLYRPQ